MNNQIQDASLSESMIKLLIVGGSQVGKSSMITRFCNNTFTSTYTPTTGVHFKYKMLDSGPKKLKVQIWDTAGTDHSNSLLKIYYKKAMGIIILFSLNDQKSLENLNAWMQYLQSHANPNAIVILIGNKSDIPERMIDPTEVSAFQKKFKIEKYVETSVKEGPSVNEVFTEVIKEVKAKIDNGLFKAEESAANTLHTSERETGSSLLGLAGKEGLKGKERTDEKKDLGIKEKENGELGNKKAGELIENARKEMSLEVEEIRKATRDELYVKLHEEVDRLRKEFMEKAKSQTERENFEKEKMIKERKNEEENIKKLRAELDSVMKSFEGLNQSMTQEISQISSRTDQTIAKLVKENHNLHERINNMEKQLEKYEGIEFSLNSKASVSKTLGGDKENMNNGLDKFGNKGKKYNQDSGKRLPRSTSDKLNIERPNTRQYKNNMELSFEKDFNESFRNCSNATESFYFGEKKGLESNEKKIIVDSFSNPYVLSETERVWEEESFKKDKSASEQTTPKNTMSRKDKMENSKKRYSPQNSIALQKRTHERSLPPAVDTFFTETVLETGPQHSPQLEGEEVSVAVIKLQNTVSLLQREIKRINSEAPSIKKSTKSSRHKRAATLANQMHCYYFRDLNRSNVEITRIWETINTLAKNTQDELDKIKGAVKASVAGRSSFGRSIKEQEAHLERNINIVIKDLRDDIHNQLIQIQRDLENSYGAFKNSIFNHFENFIKGFHVEQIKLKNHIEERCLELIKETLKPKARLEENQISPKRSSSQTLSPTRSSDKGDIKLAKPQALEIMIDMKIRKDVSIKLGQLEAQQRQILSSYTESFKGIWETVHMLADRITTVEDKNSFLGEMNRNGGSINYGFLDWKNVKEMYDDS